MDLVVFENNKPWVIDEFREGHFDYVELALDVAETKFFRFLFGQQVVDRPAQHYPSPRDRHHVPLGCTSAADSRYGCTASTASQLSLDRCPGGWSMRRARRLRVARLIPKAAIPRSNRGLQRPQPLSRQTPCDQDFLRKLARDTEPDRSRSGTTATSSP